MKLLEKTNKTYLLLSGIAFIIAGALFYFVLSIIFSNQLNEKLISDIEGIKRIIEKNGTLPNYYPFIEVKEVPAQSLSLYKTHDTLIFEPIERENILYRQISTVSNVNEKKYFIASRDTLLEQSDLLITVVIVTGSVFILLLLSLYFINKKLSLRIWQPFYNTLKILKEFSHFDSHIKLPEVSNIDEFVELNETLKTLTNKVINDYQALKRFTEDASHEIQTPLTIINTKLESLLQDPNLKNEQAVLIQAAFSASLRISRMTKALLFLAKIENNQFEEYEEVNVSEILLDQLNSIRDLIAEKSILLEEKIETGYSIKSNYFLTESLVMNLLSNSVKHCLSGGSINIELENHALRISNTGKQLTVPSEKLFERFFKENKSSDSPGLGLSIVRKICEISSWQINYENAGEIHIVTIGF